jgi:hypothetical protein
MDNIEHGWLVSKEKERYEEKRTKYCDWCSCEIDEDEEYCYSVDGCDICGDCYDKHLKSEAKV